MEKSSKKISKFIEQYMLEVVIVVMIVFMSFLSPHSEGKQYHEYPQKYFTAGNRSVWYDTYDCMWRA